MPEAPWWIAVLVLPVMGGTGWLIKVLIERFLGYLEADVPRRAEEMRVLSNLTAQVAEMRTAEGEERHANQEAHTAFMEHVRELGSLLHKDRP